jgi:tRNA pseudouridine38-40 synthase
LVDLDNIEEAVLEQGYRQRYFMHMAYDGSNYFGWQNQLSVISVQEKVEEAISKILNHKTGVVGCGRTDTGVHATNYYAHFDCFKILPEQFLFKLNNVLPNDIVVFDIWAVHADANARFDATEREYDYHLHFKKDPFLRKFSTEFRFSKPDFAVMNECASLLLNYTDFKPLSKFNPDNKTTICLLTKCAWIQTGPSSYKLNIAANRFLHNMVRRIVGTLIAIGEGKLTKAEFVQIMDSVGEFTKVQKAPAQGLHLVRVKYPFVK